MSTSRQIITVSGIPVELIRKDIKNIHFGVYPPDGSVRVSAPRHISEEFVRLAIVSRLSWITKQQEELRKRPRRLEPEYISGESHYFRGKPYVLEVVERYGKHSLCLNNNTRMLLYVSPDTTRENRALVLDNWYRQQLKQAVPGLLQKWQPVIGKRARSWGVRKMKTKWGSCNIAKARILLSLELARKSPQCLEYVLVHELVHLRERYHNGNFKRLMDMYLPQWRERRDVLNGKSPAREALEGDC